MHKFKEGDIVVATHSYDDNHLIVGASGVVRNIREYGAMYYVEVLVDFDKDIKGHGGKVCGKSLCKEGHGWFCSDKVLELVPLSLENE